jgi:DNA repair exonuclease SbcCD ATPase subunit
VLTLGGRNGAGKSSVLNAVAMALGGMSLCPDEPLKRGESRGFVELNLGELLVRREFWRDLLTEQPESGPPAYGDVKSRLIVKNPEGVKQEPAQRLLDKLIGKLTFDPTAFALEEDEKKQTEILRQIVGLDFKAHDEERSIAYDRRTVFNKQYKDQLVLLDAMPKYDGVPDFELFATDLIAELNAADEKRKAVTAAQRIESEVSSASLRASLNVDSLKQKLNALDEQITELQQRRGSTANLHREAAEAAQTAREASERAARDVKVAEDAVPDTSHVQSKMKELEDTNAKVRANKARRDVMNTVVNFQKQSEEQDALIASLDDKKATLLRTTKFPIEGLSISHDGAVTFKGINLKQASTAEQIRISVAIGFALNPALKLLCIKNGNALDDDSFKLIAEAAEAAGGQVLMEIVTKSADDVSVFIEDGHNVTAA